MPGRRDKPSDAEWILKQHAYAKSLYGGALKLADEVEELFKSDFNIPHDTADTQTPSGPRIMKPAKARATLEKFLTLLSVRATMKVRAIPNSTGEQEMRRTSKLENWVMGYQRRYQMETKRPLWRHFVYWYLLRGRGNIETRLDPAYIGSEYLPIRTFVRDPNCVFPVWGENGVGWYTCEYERDVWDIKSELAMRRTGKKKDKWRPVDLGDDDNGRVTITEYWDAKYCGALVDDELLYVREHNYGFVPIEVAHCMDTPLADMEWAYQSVLAPIMDSMKQQYVLMSKMATGVDLFYWPKILVQSPSGATVILDSGAPGVETTIPPDAKVTVISPTPNAQVLAQLHAVLQGDISLGAIPDIAWGIEPTNLQSGFAVAQVLSQIMDKIYDKKTNLECALAWDFTHKLELIRDNGYATGFSTRVPSSYEYGESMRGAKQSTMLELTPEDVGEHPYLEVTITPEMPNDRMVKAQLAQAYRAPGVDGKPLLDDQTILEKILEIEHPDTVARRVREQLLPSTSQTVQTIILSASEYEWMEENKELVKLAEKRTGLPPLSVEQMAQLQAMMAQIAQAQAAPQLPPGAPPPLPTNGGPPPETLPSQTMMQPADEIPELPTLEMSQNRRAMTPPRP